MSRRPSHPLRLSTLLALLGFGVGCGVIYTSDKPLWYVSCSGTEQDCSCDPSEYAVTKTPGVRVCSAAKAAGPCCSNDYDGCLCKAVRCVVNGPICQCSFWPKATGDLTDCGVPLPNRFCCMDAQTAICTCSPQACAAGHSPVPSCSPQFFTCDLLIGSDFGVSEDHTVPVAACSDGPIDNLDPCSGALQCSE